MICLSLSENNVSDTLKKIIFFNEISNLFEIRLDYLININKPDLKKIINKSLKPVIFTNRKREEGGRFKGSERERVEILGKTLELYPDFVDIEWKTDEKLRQGLLDRARGKNVKTIVSYHDFDGTPSLNSLEKILKNIQFSGCDYVKIVTMARKKEDISTILNLYFFAKDYKINLISFCMGEVGKISRVACLALGAPFTYTCQSSGKSTAMGQIPIKKMKKILNILEEK